MSPENLRRAYELFSAAIELPAGEQTPFLTRACGNDALLMAGVVELLRQHDQAQTEQVATPPPAAPPPSLPEIPGYEILDALGKGGMGMVYKARHRALNRVVALKTILAGPHADAEDLARFRTEAEAVARLQHPGIVQIFEIGESGRQPFVALEFVEGGNLAGNIAGSPQPAREAAGLVQKLAQAMQVAHQRSIIHRDLKPANVLLTPDGAPKITDFGLAKKLDVDTGQTVSGAIMGTASYMSPEQASGRNQEIGPASDVYSLGAILYELLTARPPFRAANVIDTLHQVQTMEPIPPSRLEPSVPRDLETICLKCLHKDPRRRYESAQGLAEDLGRFLEGQPILARPVGRVERVWRWCRRNRAVASLSLATLLLLVIGSVVAWYLAFEAAVSAANEKSARLDSDKHAATAKANEAVAKLNEKKAHEEKLRAEEHADEAWQHAYQTSISFASLSLDANRFSRTLEVLSPFQAPPPGRRDVRDWEWHAFTKRCRGAMREFRLEPGVVNIAFSPNGKLLAVANEQEKYVQLVDAVTGIPLGRWVHDHKEGWFNVCFSPNGQLLAGARGDGKILVWDTALRKEVQILAISDNPVEGLAFSSDGELFAAGAWNGPVKIWRVSDWKVIHQKRSVGQIKCLAFSPDRTWLAWGEGSGWVVLWNLKNNQVRELLEDDPSKKHTNAIQRLGFNKHGDVLASTSQAGPTCFWSVKTAKRFCTLRGCLGLSFSPDGQRFALAGDDFAVRVWEIPSGREPTVLPDLMLLNKPVTADKRGVRGARVLGSHDTLIMGLAFGADGSQLASASPDGTIKIWSVGHSSHLPTGFTQFLCFDATGERLCTSNIVEVLHGKAPILQLWDVGTGRVIRSFSGHPNPIARACLSADGKRLASASGFPGMEFVGQVRVWDVPSGRLLRQFDEPVGIHGLTLSADGKHVAWTNERSQAKVGRVDGKKAAHPLSGKFMSLSYSPAGDSLALADFNDLIEIYDKTGETRLRQLKIGNKPTEWYDLNSGVKSAYSLAFSADGTWIAVGGIGVINVAEFATGKLVVSLRTNAGVAGLSFHPDRKRLISSMMRSEHAILWDLTKGRELAAIRGKSALFAQNGTRLAVTRDLEGVLLLEGRPHTPELALESEALDLLRFLCVYQGKTQKEATGFIKNCVGITEQLRQRALELILRFYPENST